VLETQLATIVTAAKHKLNTSVCSAAHHELLPRSQETTRKEAVWHIITPQEGRRSGGIICREKLCYLVLLIFPTWKHPAETDERAVNDESKKVAMAAWGHHANNKRYERFAATSAVTCEIYESFLWNLENETPVGRNEDNSQRPLVVAWTSQVCTKKNKQ